ANKGSRLWEKVLRRDNRRRSASRAQGRDRGATARSENPSSIPNGPEASHGGEHVTQPVVLAPQLVDELPGGRGRLRADLGQHLFAVLICSQRPGRRR